MQALKQLAEALGFDVLCEKASLYHLNSAAFFLVRYFYTPVRDKDLPRIVPIAYSFQYALAVPRAYSRRNSMLPVPHRDS